MVVTGRDLNYVGAAACFGTDGLNATDVEILTAAHTKFRPASPRSMRFTSRVVQPPASGVPALDIAFRFRH